MTNQTLTEIATRHQVHLERLKAGAIKENEIFLTQIDKVVTGRLAGRELTTFKRNKLEKLIASVRGDLSLITGDIANKIAEQAKELAVYEAGFEVRSLNEVITADFTVPTTAALTSAVFTNPLSIAGPDGGNLLKPFLKGATKKQVDAISLAIRSGYYEGQTTNQILQRIRGTRSQKFKNGVIARTGTAINSMVRTSLQHASVQARETTWRANTDVIKAVRWTSTIDGRTSQICRSLDGREYPYDKGPRPPIHINCRSSITPVLKDKFSSLRKGATRFSRGPEGVKYIPASQSYYGWLKNQPAAFQDSAIGRTRGLLLRNGGLSADRFAALNLNKNFKPTTLAEMRKLEPAAFDKANL